jgi:hypothetical protein
MVPRRMERGQDSISRGNVGRSWEEVAEPFLLQSRMNTGTVIDRKFWVGVGVVVDQTGLMGTPNFYGVLSMVVEMANKRARVFWAS